MKLQLDFKGLHCTTDRILWMSKQKVIPFSDLKLMFVNSLT